MLEMAVLIDQLTKARCAKPRHPFADPLDAPEWQGLHWVLLLFRRAKASEKSGPKPSDARFERRLNRCHDAV